MLKLKNHAKIRGEWAKIKAEDYTYLSLNKPDFKKFQKWISVAGSRCHKQNCYTNPALLFYLQFSYCLYVYWHLYITVSDKVSMKNSLDFKQWRLLLVIRWNHPSKHSCALSHTSPIDTDTQLTWVPYCLPALAQAASSNFTHFHPILTFFHLFLNHKRSPPPPFFVFFRQSLLLKPKLISNLYLSLLSAGIRSLSSTLYPTTGFVPVSILWIILYILLIIPCQIKPLSKFSYVNGQLAPPPSSFQGNTSEE